MVVVVAAIAVVVFAESPGAATGLAGAAVEENHHQIDQLLLQTFPAAVAVDQSLQQQQNQLGLEIGHYQIHLVEDCQIHLVADCQIHLVEDCQIHLVEDC